MVMSLSLTKRISKIAARTIIILFSVFFEVKKKGALSERVFGFRKWRNF